MHKAQDCFHFRRAGGGAEFIREAREARDAQLEEIA